MAFVLIESSLTSLHNMTSIGKQIPERVRNFPEFFLIHQLQSAEVDLTRRENLRVSNLDGGSLTWPSARFILCFCCVPGPLFSLLGGGPFPSPDHAIYKPALQLVAFLSR